MSKPLEPNRRPFGGKRGPPDLDSNARLPSKKALDFLTKGPPAQQRIQQFGRLTPIGSGSTTFGAVPRRAKKDGF